MANPWEQYAQPVPQPQQSPAWASDLSRKDQAEIKMKMYTEGRKRLSDLQSAISDGGTTMGDLNEYLRINQKQGTGGLWNQITPDKQMFRSPESMQMSSIQSRMAPSQRPEGSGASSDRDVALFLKSLPSTENYGEVNEGIRADYERKYNSAIEKSNAMKAHLDENGNLSGFDGAWAQRKSPVAPVKPALQTAPKEAISMLKMSPNLAAAYDEKYGAGSAAKVLGR